jgi:hypothetical protein
MLASGAGAVSMALILKRASGHAPDACELPALPTPHLVEMRQGLPCHYPRPDRYPAAPGQSVKSAFRLRTRAKKPNHQHRRLLRARRERVDELAFS